MPGPARKIWSHNTSTDTSREVPFWGISSSPLIVDDVVIVSVGGTLSGYDVATGKQRWIGPLHGGSYSSPHLATIDGVTQVVILSAPGAVSVNPADGKLLWEYKWEGGAIVQPGGDRRRRHPDQRDVRDRRRGHEAAGHQA